VAKRRVGAELGGGAGKGVLQALGLPEGVRAGPARVVQSLISPVITGGDELRRNRGSPAWIRRRGGARLRFGLRCGVGWRRRGVRLGLRRGNQGSRAGFGRGARRGSRPEITGVRCCAARRGRRSRQVGSGAQGARGAGRRERVLGCA